MSIGAQLYLDSHRTGPHLGGSAPYQGFFHTQDSNPRPLVKGGAAPSAASYPLVVVFNEFTRYRTMGTLLVHQAKGKIRDVVFVELQRVWSSECLFRAWNSEINLSLLLLIPFKTVRNIPVELKATIEETIYRSL